jgi:hypothetical protein
MRQAVDTPRDQPNCSNLEKGRQGNATQLSKQSGAVNSEFPVTRDWLFHSLFRSLSHEHHADHRPRFGAVLICSYGRVVRSNAAPRCRWTELGCDAKSPTRDVSPASSPRQLSLDHGGTENYPRCCYGLDT